ncbi:SAM-dependent methyltransferase [Nocardiopsis sp. N85]|nr:SAM-dependent methyltransferase [Nocardiopsis sp. N85]MDE3724194.1 SAM-dependent methyltransferase [Nocardiopsis sp. N85]
MRPVEDFTRYLDGFEPIDPGAVSVLRWRPDPTGTDSTRDPPR